ncbi:hypothetical protein [Eubacterium limosum]|uniref:hypothetical protein n=1 Tax=Eubacterium limosum TaxID=1736 RepID=UPI001062552D|nr:hypothetical protein [Eubacterium limosum]
MDIRVIGRNIQIDSVEMFAIENDNLTDSVNFVFDRYQGDTNLFNLFPFIVYRTASKTQFEILERSLSEDLNKVIAKWTITRSITKESGRFDFCVTFVGSNEYLDMNNGSSVWSTKISSLNVAKSLVGEDFTLTDEPIMIEMMRLVTELYEPIEQAKNAAVQARTASEDAFRLVQGISDMIDDINGESVSNESSMSSINGKGI